MAERKSAYILASFIVVSGAWSVWTLAYVMWICGWWSSIPGNAGFPVEMFAIYAACFAVLGCAIILALKRKRSLAAILLFACCLVETTFWLSVMT